MKADEELTPSVGTAVACEAISVPQETAYRHRLPKTAAAPRPRAASPRALSGEERKRVLDVLHDEAFAHKAPAETYAKLLDQGTYLCSIRTMYRVLDAHQEVRERRNQLRHPAHDKPHVVATAPNQVWTSNITKLLGPAKWTSNDLYVILDIFSRYVVGWMLASRQSQDLAERLIRQTLIKEGIGRDQLRIHSDRGAAMRSQAVVHTAQAAVALEARASVLAAAHARSGSLDQPSRESANSPYT